MIIVLVFLVMTSFMILINYGIHLYYKNKRKVFFKTIDEKDFLEIKDVKIEICGRTNFSRSYKKIMSDVLLYENSIFLLLRNYSLDGLINQNQPIVQLCNDVNTKRRNGVDKLYGIQKIEYDGYRIKAVMNTKAKVILDFEGMQEEMNLTEVFLEKFYHF